MEVLALDIGAVWVGMARANSQARLAEPLQTVKTNEAIAAVQKLVEKQPVEAIVVGLPRNLSGEDTDQTRWVRDWVAKAKTQINRPFYWQDESLTSLEAKLKVQSSKFKDQGIGEHGLAAAIILQDFLDAPVAKRVVC
ncbi:Holliday junction resolvase RuvX [Candidatus Saccharibacteria bacterium]|nr:Holliday junction resolvase RuvX [Candidatus Saccharibacteria bacterium]